VLVNQRERQDRAFFESVREAPDDDAARLIYADWLEEYGDEARAEFIRVQCQLTRLSLKDEQRPALEQRECELLMAHRGTWLGPLSKVLSYGDCVFRRGFPEELTVRPKLMVQLAKEFEARVPAGRVKLCGGFGDPAMRALVVSPRLDWVRGLHYEHPRLTESGLVDLAEAKGLPRLTDLSIKFADFTTGGIRALASSPHRHALRSVALHVFGYHRSVYPESAIELAKTGTTFRLRKLRLEDHNIGPDGAEALAGAAHLAELRELDLMMNRIQDKGASALARSPYLGGLSMLNLHFNGLTARAVREMVDSPLLRGIRELVLGCNDIGDEGAEALAACPHLSPLTRLELYDVKLSDRGAGALAASPYLTQLTDLELTGNELTDRGSQALFESSTLQQLEQISIGGMSSLRGKMISPDQRRQWIKRLGKGARV
jgi:uncharacterized protein (TIGR02996 family)